MKPHRRLVFSICILVLLAVTAACSIPVSVTSNTSTPAAPTENFAATFDILKQTESALQTAAAVIPTLAATATQLPAPTATSAPFPPVVLGKFGGGDPHVLLVDPLTGATLNDYQAPGANEPYWAAPAGTSGLVYTQDDGTRVWHLPYGSAPVELPFVNSKGGVYEGVYLPSPDGTRLAWSEVLKFDASGTSVVMKTANLDGSSAQVLFQRDMPEPRRPEPLKWSNDGQWLYYTNMLYGIGGYILFGGYPDLYRINLDTKAEEKIFPAGDATASMTPMSLSPDETRLAYIGRGQPLTLVIRELSSGTERMSFLPDRYQTGGSLIWSPDGTQLLVSLALNNPEAEAFTTLKMDTATLVATTLIPEDARQFRPVLWSAAGVAWVQDYENNVWTIDPGTGTMTKIAAGAWVLHRGWD